MICGYNLAIMPVQCHFTSFVISMKHVFTNLRLFFKNRSIIAEKLDTVKKTKYNYEISDPKLI